MFACSSCHRVMSFSQWEQAGHQEEVVESGGDAGVAVAGAGKAGQAPATMV